MTAALKILFVQPYISFEGIISDTLAGHLARRGHKVEIIAYLRNKKKSEMLSEAKDIQIHPMNAVSLSIPNVMTEFPYFFSLDEVIKRIQPDLIHINNFPFLTTFQATRVAKKLHIKCVVHVHGVIGDRGFFLNSLQKYFGFTLGHSIFNDTGRLICLTAKDAQEIVSYGCSIKKIRIIPNGVDIDKFRPMGKGKPNSIIWCGRFVHQKGLEYLIEAMRIIVREKRNTEIRLVLVGDGPLFSRIYQIVRKHNLLNNIILKGLLPRNQLPHIINEASLFALPSLNEGMPYVLLEAMACGKAVIGSDISGINDIICHKETGFLVKPRDSRALAYAISELLVDDNLRKKMGQNARQLMMKKYSWSQIVTRMEAVYTEAD
jgi:glycosyltransferase involved in cell wall biosynthesis